MTDYQARIEGFLADHAIGRGLGQEIDVAVDDLHSFLYQRGMYRHPREIQWEEAAKAAERLANALRGAPKLFGYEPSEPAFTECSPL